LFIFCSTKNSFFDFIIQKSLLCYYRFEIQKRHKTETQVIKNGFHWVMVIVIVCVCTIWCVEHPCWFTFISFPLNNRNAHANVTLFFLGFFLWKMQPSS
jgi:hypothetical protein